MSFNRLKIATWITHQVQLDEIKDPAESAEIEAHCLALACTGLPNNYRFAERAQLLWRGVTRGNRNTTAGLDDPDDDADTLLKSYSENHYHPVLRKFFEDNGVLLYTMFAITPEEVAFTLAKGSLVGTAGETHWGVRHLYNGKHPFQGRAHTLDAHHDGDHFTQSAGMVALPSLCDEGFMKYGSVVKCLRWRAFETFGYDPDHYFVLDAEAHDQFGFTPRHGRKPIIP